MSTFKCKMCGGSLEIERGQAIAECEYCGARQTLPKLDDDRRANLYDRANHLRRGNEFDKAAAIYEQILNEDASDAEAYWSLVLCHYGIEYVEDPRTHKRVPTVHRAQFTSIFDDENYKSAVESADAYQRILYEEEAAAINEIQKGILEISGKEDPFDVFICYKETDENGRRTADSVLGQELYYQLKQEGFKVFFARITLEDKLGSAYEPYIFAALNSAKVMVVLGTRPEHFNAVWVTNEWSRFLSLIRQGKKKMLIPAYRDMDPYDLPKEFSHLQAQDMSKLGFMQDLIRGIKKLVGREKKMTEPAAEPRRESQEVVASAAPLLRRAFLFLEDEEFNMADEYAEKVLDINPECAEAYVVKLLVELELTLPEELASADEPLSDLHNYQKAVRFASDEYRAALEGYNRAIMDRLEQERLDSVYEEATSLLEGGAFDDAAKLFASIWGYRDAAAMATACVEAKEEERKKRIYSSALDQAWAARATEADMEKGIAALRSISAYRDAGEQAVLLTARLEEWREKKRLAEEAARRKAEEDRLRRAAAARKAKKIAKICVIAGAIFSVLLVLFFTLILPPIRYRDAEDLLARGNLRAARAVYADLGDYSESAKRIKLIDGALMLQDDLAGGVKKILSSGTSVKITYDFNGGALPSTVSASASEGDVVAIPLSATTSSDRFRVITYNSPSEFVNLPTPDRSGYSFDAWEMKNYWLLSDGTFVLRLTANWNANSYTVTFGDTVSLGTVTFEYNDGRTPMTVNLRKGETLVYPTVPQRSGYLFAGWCIDRACTQLYSFSGTINESFTLYARWVANAKENTITVGTNTSVVLYGTALKYYAFVPLVGGTITVYTSGSRDTYGYLYDDSFRKLTYDDNGRDGFNFQYTYNVTPGKLYYIGVRSPYSNATATAQLYVSGTQKPTSTAKAASSSTVGYQDGRKTTATVTYGATCTLPTPSREGYVFLGWYNGNTKVSSGVWGIAGNVTLVPRWKAAEHTVTLNPNGGTVSQTTVSVAYDTPYTLPTPEREGYDFLGWYDSNNIKYEGGTWRGNADLTLGAKWQAASYTVTYEDVANSWVVTLDHNDGTGEKSSVNVPFGYRLAYPDIPQRSGYVFAGWYTDSACTEKYGFRGDITGDITLYAKWVAPAKENAITVGANTWVVLNGTEIQYYAFVPLVSERVTVYTEGNRDTYGYLYDSSMTPIVYDDDSGSDQNFSYTYNVTAGSLYYVGIRGYSSSSMEAVQLCISGTQKPYSAATASGTGYCYGDGHTETATVTYGVAYTLPTPPREGYTFLGWYNGATKVESGVWDIAGNVTLVPRWKAAEHTVTLNPNGGTVSQTTVSVAYDTPYTLPTPEREGYDFLGWYDGNNIKYAGGTWHGNADVSLVAQWTVKTYNLTLSNTERKDIVVTFDNNYSGSTPSTVTLEDGEPLSYPTEPTRNGYAFIGWFTDSSCTTRYNFTGTVTDNMTLYAGWKQISFTNQYTKVEVDPTEYTSSSDSLGISTGGTSSSQKKYVYFVAQETGTYHICYKNSTSSSSYKYYLYIYNLTTGSTIKSTTVSSTSYTSASVACSAGDVIVMAVYKYSSSSYYESTAYFYFAGFSSVTSSAIAEAEDYMYSSTLNYSEQVTYGSSFTLPTPTRTDYRFLGWYNGNTKVEAGTWNYDSNVTLTPKWEEIVYYNVTFNNTMQAIDKINVTFNYNYSGSTNTVVELRNGDTLTYPTVPTRSGYAFAGWYTDSSCTTKYSFSGTITEDTTLYAKWVSMQASNYGSEYLDIANYTSSSRQKSITASSYSGYNYYYFTCYKDGTYIICGTWTEGDFMFNVSNVTKGTTIISCNLCSGRTSTSSQSFTASAGDVICVRTTRYSSSYNYTSNGKFYVSGASYPTSTAVAQCSETSGMEYSYGNSVTAQVEYGVEVTLPAISRIGYTFLGWYNGETKVESGVWAFDTDVTLTPKWRET